MGTEHDEREAIHGVLHRLEQRWNILPIPSDEWHAYNRLPFWDFLRGIREAAALTQGRRFVDLGCGIGTNMAVAHHLGWEVVGVESRHQYASAARELIPEATVLEADIRSLRSLNADLVYMYRPAKTDDLEHELEKHVLSLLEKGTVCFWPFRHDPEVWMV